MREGKDLVLKFKLHLVFYYIVISVGYEYQYYILVRDCLCAYSIQCTRETTSGPKFSERTEFFENISPSGPKFSAKIMVQDQIFQDQNSSDSSFSGFCM